MQIKEYYDTRAPEYDEWYLGQGRFAKLDRPGWDEEVREWPSSSREQTTDANRPPPG